VTIQNVEKHKQKWLYSLHFELSENQIFKALQKKSKNDMKKRKALLGSAIR